MKYFTAVENRSYFFSSCEGCPAKCCDGREGSIFSQLLLEDFELVSKNFPILFSFGEIGYLKAVVLLSNGKDFCPYIQNHQCTIYENRPNVCRNYPLSGNLDNKIYIDEGCPAVSSQEIGTAINIENTALKDYQEKFLETHFYLEKFNHKEDFSLVVTINNIDFYQYQKNSEDEFMKYHIYSLKHLEKILSSRK